MRFRCVKCNEPHDPGQCKLPAATHHEAHKVFCVACNVFGHPASYRGCPQIKRFRENVAKRREEDKNVGDVTRVLANKYTRPGVSFRDAIASTSQANVVSTRLNTTPADRQTSIDPGIKELICNIINEALPAALRPIQLAIQQQSSRVNEIYEALFP